MPIRFELLMVEDVAKALHVSEHTVRRLIRQKKLACVMLSNRYRVPLSALERFVETHTIYEIDYNAPL